MFDLERVQKSGARFDPEKTKWYNHQYLQQKPLETLRELFKPVLQEAGVPQGAFPDDYLEAVVSLIRERASFVNEFWELGHYFFTAPTTFDEKAVGKQWKAETPARMLDLAAILEDLEDFTSANTEQAVKQWITDSGFSFGQVMPPLRLVLVGAMQGPHLFDIMELLGKEETLSRIHYAVDTL